MRNLSNRHSAVTASVLFFLAMGSVPLGAATLYVSPSGSNTAPYASWATASTRIQPAINASTQGDVIVVDSGTYYENIDIGPRNISLVSRYFLTSNESYIASTVLDGSNAGAVVSVGTNTAAGALISGFTIQHGKSPGFGGGIQCWHGNLRVERSVVRNNEAALHGGGIYLEWATCVVKNVRIENNLATNMQTGGGGVRCSYARLEMENSSVVSNRTKNDGGAFHLYHSDVTVKSSLIAYNIAMVGGGGGIYLDGSNPTFINCTMCGNVVQGSDVGGALNASFTSKPVLRNCILWSNSPQQVSFSTNWSGMNVTIQYSDVQGGSNGVTTFGKGPVYWRNSLDTNPLFAAGGFSLQSASPCVNSGTNESWMSGAFDAAGNARVVGSTVDMGAYEHQVVGGDGLLLHYSFDADTGSTVPDLSGHGHNGQVSGAVYTNAGRFGGAYHYDGVNDYILGGSLGNVFQGTISFWMYADAIENWRNPFSTDYASWDDCIRFEESSPSNFVVGLGPILGGAFYTSNLQARTWYHVVFAWTTNGYWGWLNATSAFSGAHNNQLYLNLNNVAVGNGYSTSASRYWKGMVDEVRIYNRVLTGPEVAELYGSGSPTGGVTVTTPGAPAGDATNYAGTNLVFTTSGSTCSDGSPAEYRIDWGDGSASSWSAVGAAFHAWAAAGTYYLKAQARSVSNSAAVSAWSALKRLDILASTNLGDGLLLHYSFDTDTGSTVPDLSGHGHNGQVFGAVYTNAGRFGGAYRYDGANDYILGGNLGYVFQGTISFWMYADATENWRNPFSTDYASWDDCIRFEESSPSNFVVGLGPILGGAFFTSNLQARTWYHVVFAWTPNGYWGWLNGTSTFSGVHNNELYLNFNNVAVGNGYSTSPDRYWKGMVDEVRIYNRAMTSPEVLELYGSGSPTGGVVTVTTPGAPVGDATNYAGTNLVFTTSGSTCSDGSPAEYRIDWGDGSASSWSPGGAALDHAWAAAGAYYLKAQARSVSNSAAVSAWSAPKRLEILVHPPLVHYVAPGGANVSPYTSWAIAAHRIQDAIDVAENGAKVIVSNATYYETLSFKGKDINLVSLYDETGDDAYIRQTIIDASNMNSVIVMTNGETAAARVSGFTLQNGRAEGAGAYRSSGGGIRCVHASPTIENLIIQNNWVASQGGGIYFEWAYSDVRNVIIRNNSGPGCGGGGGIRSSYGAIHLFNVTVVSNNSQSGAGVFLYHGTPTLQNVLIADNISTGEGGGAMYFDGCSPDMVNVTIAGNRATGDGEGGGLNVSYYSHPKLVNCVMWSNWPQEVYFNADWYGMAITFDHSDVQGGAAGVVTLGKGPVNWLGGSIDQDPQFVGERNYRLQAASPCVDAGTNQPWMSGETELDGNPRIFNSVVDMGAYEFAPSADPVGSVTCEINPPDVRGAGAAWRLTAGPDTNWYSSGDTLRSVPPGAYTMTFRALDGWIEPGDQGISVATNVTTSATAIYQAEIQDDALPPVVVSIFPWDGYVTHSNKMFMTIVATDNVGVAWVTVNDEPTEWVSANTYRYLVKPLNGQYHYQTVVASDVFGNRTTQVVCYAQSSQIRLTAIWNGYWRVRNPFDDDFPYTWQVKHSTESGPGICLAHSDDYFNTSLGEKNVQILDTNGNVIAEKGWSPKDTPEEPVAPAFVDSDLDGLLNIEEDIAGSDPEDAGSSFGVGVGGAAGGGGAGMARGLLPRSDPGTPSVFTWASGSNSLYTLEVSTNLDYWTCVPGMIDVPGNGQTMSYTNIAQDSFFFMRIWARRATLEP